MENLENTIITMDMKKLCKIAITEIHINIDDFLKLKCSDIDGDAPFCWLLNCLNQKDKDLVIDRIIKIV